MRCSQHTKMPSGYSAWHEAADQLGKAGYTQKRCPDCLLFKNWITPDGGRLKTYKDAPGTHGLEECGCLTCLGLR